MISATQESLVSSVARGEIFNRREVTNDPARFYRYRWESATTRLSVYERRILDDLLAWGEIGFAPHPHNYAPSTSPVRLRTHETSCDLGADCCCGDRE